MVTDQNIFLGIFRGCKRSFLKMSIAIIMSKRKQNRICVVVSFGIFGSCLGI